jgi:hypothetical protein
MALPPRYRAIFLAGPTFNLLPDDDTASRALVAIGRHLTPDGTALIPLFVPEPIAADELGTAREQRAADGSLRRVTALSQTMDHGRRTCTTLLRYERHAPDGAIERLDRPWVLHWYDPGAFTQMVRDAGMRVIEVRPTDADDPAAGSTFRIGSGEVPARDEDGR